VPADVVSRTRDKYWKLIKGWTGIRFAIELVKEYAAAFGLIGDAFRVCIPAVNSPMLCENLGQKS